jgi:hypothetical protein
MSEDVIQCPTCSKRYRLPDKVPATFTCRSCQTVMDLSGFQQAAAPAPGATPPSRGGGRARAGGGSAAGRRSAARRGGGRGRAPAEEEYEDGGRGYAPQKKDNTALLWGSVGLFVLAVVALVLVFKGGGDEEKEPETTTTAGGSAGNHGLRMPTGDGSPTGSPPAPGTPAPGTPAGAPTGSPPPAPGTPPAGPPPSPGTPGGQPPAAGSQEGLPAPEGKTNYPSRRAEVKSYPWRDDVTGEERNAIEQAVRTAVEESGADARDAQDWLVTMDLKAAGRLVSEFKRLKDEYGLEDPEGLARMQVVDRVLRRIDGVQERTFRTTTQIKPVSPVSAVEKIMRQWNWWWDLEKWRIRHKPWDPRVDEADPDSEGGDEGGGS